VAALWSSRRGEATDEEARWPSDKDDTGLDHNALGLSGSTQLYPGAKLGLCNSPINRMREPPSPSPLSHSLISPFQIGLALLLVLKREVYL
jgi:hypothetical protein